VHVVKVDEKEQKITVLAPSPGLCDVIRMYFVSYPQHEARGT